MCLINVQGLQLRQCKNDSIDWKIIWFEFAACFLSPSKRAKKCGKFKTKNFFQSIEQPVPLEEQLLRTLTIHRENRRNEIFDHFFRCPFSVFNKGQIYRQFLYHICYDFVLKPDVTLTIYMNRRKVSNHFKVLCFAKKWVYFTPYVSEFHSRCKKAGPSEPFIT